MSNNTNNTANTITITAQDFTIAIIMANNVLCQYHGYYVKNLKTTRKWLFFGPVQIKIYLQQRVQTVAELEYLLNQHLQHQNFEAAAIIRDKIENLKGKK